MGAVVTQEGKRLPVSLNGAAILPQRLGFAWTPIQNACEAIAIIAEGAVAEGLSLLLRTVDLQGRLRMFSVADVEIWKGVVYTLGRYRAGEGMEMGKKAAENNGQPNKALIVTIAKQIASEEKWGTG